MPIGSELRFRLLLDFAKQVIFAVDNFPWRLRIPYRRAGRPRILVPDVGRKVLIISRESRLDSWFVAADGVPGAAVLLCHGIGDRITYWRRAQERLAQAGISSLIFAYSGYPGSSRTTTTANLAEDAHAAYAWLRSNGPTGTAIFVMGFSLGSGLAAEVTADLEPAPAGLILAEAFSSLREAARRIVRPLGFIGNVLPDVWRTRHNIRRVPCPVLVVHSTGDALFPVTMAEEIQTSGRDAGRNVELRVLPDYPHNAAYLTVPEDYWTAIIDFIGRHTGSS